MALFVLSLAIIDVVILLTYTAIEAVRDNLGVKLTANRELSKDTLGVIILNLNISQTFSCNYCSLGNS